jgi:putative ABC transport system substrate-binding protein
MQRLRRIILRAMALSPCIASFATAQVSATAPHKIAWIGRNPFPGTPLPSKPNPFLVLFRDRLAELGFVEGRNLEIRSFVAKSLSHDDVVTAIRQAVEWRPTFIKIRFVRDTRIALSVTSTVPIVFSLVGDPVAAGLVKTLTQPGGNATGVAILYEAMALKRFELARAIVPGVRTVGLFFDSRSAPGPDESLKQLRAAADGTGVALETADMAKEKTLDGVLEQLRKLKAGVVMPVGLVYDPHYEQVLAAFQARSRIPVIEDSPEYVEAGAVAGIFEEYRDHYRRAAAVAVKILRGESPSGVPVDSTVRFSLVLNLRSAQAMGLKFPEGVLLSAERVIK